MKIIKRITIFSLVFSIILFPALVFSDTEESYEEIIKDYEFNAESTESLSYDAPQTITEDGVEYSLQSVSYEVTKEIKPQTVEKEVNLNNLEDFKKEITEKIDGKDVVLKVEKEPNWTKTELPRERITKEEVRRYSQGDNIPAEMVLDGERYVETFREEVSDFEPFEAPAVFYASEKGARLYLFNGKLIELSLDEPYWDGWTSDVMAYFDIATPEYTVETISWAGDFEGEDGSYTRTAVVTGRRRIYDVVVTYQYDSERELKEEDIEYLYTAKVTYTEEIEPSIEAICHAVYAPIIKEVPEEPIVEVKEGLSTTQKVFLAGISILGIAAIGAGILFATKKKREEDK